MFYETLIKAVQIPETTQARYDHRDPQFDHVGNIFLDGTLL